MRSLSPFVDGEGEGRERHRKRQTDRQAYSLKEPVGYDAPFHFRLKTDLALLARARKSGTESVARRDWPAGCDVTGRGRNSAKHVEIAVSKDLVI